MRTTRVMCLSALMCALSAAPLAAQRAKTPVRTLTPPVATSTPFGSVTDVREIGGGRLLVNSSGDRTLALLDASLGHATVLADTAGASRTTYQRGTKLIPYLGDSTLMVEFESRALVMIDPDGKLGRVLAPPRPQDFNSLTSGGPVGVDARGRLIYQSGRVFTRPPTCSIGGDSTHTLSTKEKGDSVFLIRADFDTRGVDTIGRSQIVPFGAGFPVAIANAQCKIVSARYRIDPSVPLTDSWTVTSRGDVAVVRGHDYHIDWIGSDGARRSTAKLPFDWRRLTDADKGAKVDSARHVVDSLLVAGGYQLQSCMGGRMTTFSVNPPASPSSGGGASGSGSGSGAAGVTTAFTFSGGGGGGGGAPSTSDCQKIQATPVFAPIDSMADYIAPIREGSARADREGNVWILPTTSLTARGGLLYDVVNPDGELVERVQLPADRDIAAFGRGGVLYLSHRTAQGTTIEKVKIVRS